MTDFLEACKCGDLELVKTLSEQYQHWNYGMKYACLGGYLDIVKLMIEKGANNLNWGFGDSCLKGHLKIVKFMMKKGANDWNLGMIHACRGGHIDIVKLMIEKGANDWNNGMLNACDGEYLEIVKFMMEEGATEWKLEEIQNEELVNSLSFSELKKYMKLKIVPLNVKKIIQKRLYFSFQIYIHMFLSSNMFSVLTVFL